MAHNLIISILFYICFSNVRLFNGSYLSKKGETSSTPITLDTCPREPELNMEGDCCFLYSIRMLTRSHSHELNYIGHLVHFVFK